MTAESAMRRVALQLWEMRVRALEDAGLTRSEAQGVVDAQDMREARKVTCVRTEHHRLNQHHGTVSQ